MSVSYTAILPVPERTVDHLTGLLTAERRRRGTREGRRALTARDQAILVLRWFVDGTRMEQLALDNAIGLSTGYDYVHEAIDVLAARAPSLASALLAAKAAGHEHIGIDGMLVHTDRVREPGPTTRKNSRSGTRVDLWWSGKHHGHGGNVQVVTAPDGWPLWTSDVRPGREHDTTAMRKHAQIRPAFTAWTVDAEHPVLADLGYEGESGLVTVAVKKPAGGALTAEQVAANKAHNAKRALAERGNALLKVTFKALRRVTLCPWRIGDITAAALVLLHTSGQRTT
jgi:DDE superfamily endonuclease